MFIFKEASLALLSATILTHSGVLAKPVAQSTVNDGAGSPAITQVDSDLDTSNSSANGTDFGAVSSNSTLGLPFAPKFRDTIKSEVRVTGKTKLKATSVTHMWLTFAREQWVKPWLTAGPTQGTSRDQNVAGAEVNWGIDWAIDEHKYVVLGWGAVLAAKTLLNGFPNSPTQDWLIAMKVKLTWSNLLDRTPFAELYGDIVQRSIIEDISGDENPQTSKPQTSKRDLVSRGDTNGSTESLGVLNESKLNVFITDSPIPAAIPTLDLLALITEVMSIYIYQHKATNYLYKIWYDGPELEIVKYRGLIFTFKVLKTREDKYYYTIADLEQAFRMLIIAPQLDGNARIFDATAAITNDKGGIGPAFVEMSVTQNSVRPVGSAGNETYQALTLGQGL